MRTEVSRKTQSRSAQNKTKSSIKDSRPLRDKVLERSGYRSDPPPRRTQITTARICDLEQRGRLALAHDAGMVEFVPAEDPPG